MRGAACCAGRPDPHGGAEPARGPMLWAQAPKRGSRGVYASRRWVCGAPPVVRDDRTRKGQRRRCAAGAVGGEGRRGAMSPTRGVGGGADGRRRAIALTRGAGWTAKNKAVKG